jgi:anthranilate/para-aminobenzoate synthase component II
MQILLVDNNTKHKKALLTSLNGHDIETVFYHPGLNIRDDNKDLIILSGGGGEGFEINDSSPSGDLWYRDEMEYVLRSTKPIVGICMGFEVICRAYGDNVVELGETVQGFKQIQTTNIGKKQIGKSKIKQYEAHKFGVKKLKNKQFDVLAESNTGIEVIRHKKRPILATQFHPEIRGGSLKLEQLVKSMAS